MSKNRYFMGVMDIEVATGTIGDMKVVDSFRVFNDRFVKTPDLALLVAFDERNERWKTCPAAIMKDVTYDPKTKEWKRIFFETTKGHTPTEKMMEKWKRGEYVLNLITEYVQIMETDLVGDENLVKAAISNWNHKMNYICTNKNEDGKNFTDCNIQNIQYDNGKDVNKDPNPKKFK